MRIAALISIMFLSACATNPPASLVSWNGKSGKVRQGVFGPIHESKVDPEMTKIMTEKCPSGFSVTNEGSDVIPAAMGSAEAKTKEFSCN